MCWLSAIGTMPKISHSRHKLMLTAPQSLHRPSRLRTAQVSFVSCSGQASAYQVDTLRLLSAPKSFLLATPSTRTVYRCPCGTTFHRALFLLSAEHNISFPQNLFDPIQSTPSTSCLVPTSQTRPHVRAPHIMHSPAKVAIIGGGILGLATARELLLRGVRPLTVLEAEPIIASHQTARNSGVVHAGIYYAPNSLKATLCLEGLQRSYQYFDQHQIPYNKVGKIIVALDHTELPALETLYRNAQINRVPDVQFLESLEEIHRLQPGCAGVAAIYSPHTGIVDWAAVARSYADEVRSMGGIIQTASRVLAMDHHDLIHLHIQTPVARKVVKAERVISCAGVQSDRVAALLDGVREPAIIPVRGEYLRIANPGLASRITMNIYPVPDSGSGSPFLGVHFTPTLSGDVIVGPNAVLAFARNGYKATDFSWRDITDMIRYPGFWRLATRFWRYGAREAYRGAFISSAANAARRYMPAVQVEDFERQGPEKSGIRAQAISATGALVDDFVFESAADGRVLHTRNAPSPGATSSLAIARVIADKSLEVG